MSEHPVFGPPPAFPGFGDIARLGDWIGAIRSRAFFSGARHEVIDHAEAVAIIAAIERGDHLPASVADCYRDSDIAAHVGEVERLREEIADLKSSVVAFGAPWAGQYARDFGFPPSHLHATHYDILEKAGARMDSFVRHDPQALEASR